MRNDRLASRDHRVWAPGGQVVTQLQLAKVGEGRVEEGRGGDALHCRLVRNSGRLYARIISVEKHSDSKESCSNDVNRSRRCHFPKWPALDGPVVNNASALFKSLDATFHFFMVLVPATADVAEIDGKLAGYNDHVFAPIARISFCPTHPLPRKQALVHTGSRWSPSSTRAVNRRETQPCVDSGTVGEGCPLGNLYSA